MRIGIAVAGPQTQGRLLAAVRQHRLHHAAVDLALLDAGPGGVAARRQHQVADLRRLAEDAELFVALDGAHLLQHVVEMDELGAGQNLLQAQINAVRQPAVGIERAGQAVHADAAAFELEFLDALGDRVRPGALARADVADPGLSAAPAFEEGRHQHEASRIALAREHQHVEFGIAADRAEIAAIDDAKVPPHSPYPEHEAIEVAGRHLLAYRRPAPVALAQRKSWQLENVTHDGLVTPLAASAVAGFP